MTQYYLTQDDVNNYGQDLTDFSMRAAAHALTPHLQEIERQQAELRQQVAREQRARLDAAVAAAVPSFREIDSDPSWHQWLLGVDTYSGRVRQILLNDAIAAGDAARVIQFFRGLIGWLRIRSGTRTTPVPVPVPAPMTFGIVQEATAG
jgi:hypothetical protein